MKNIETTYTTSDIARLNIKRERLKVWMEKGWIKPSVQVAKGAGTKNLFNRLDLYIILLFKQLVEHGFTGEEAHSRIGWANYSNGEAITKVFGEDEYVVFFKGNFPDNQAKPQLYTFSTKNKSNNLVEFLNFYLPSLETAIVINFLKVKEQVDNLTA